MPPRNSNRRRNWTWLLAVGVVVALAAAWAFVEWSDETLVDAAAVERTTIASYVEERAKTRVPTTHVVSAPYEGRALPVELEEGERVRKDQVVARMEQSDLERDRARLRARLDEIDAEIRRNDDDSIERTLIEQIDAALVSIDRTVEAAAEQTRASEARAEFFRAERERVTAAFEEEAASEQEMRRARLQDVESDVELKADVLTLRATEAIRVAARIAPRLVREFIERKSLTEAVLATQRAQVAQRLAQVEADLERARLRSPVEGVVLRRAVESLTALPAGATLLEIGQLEDLEIEVEMLTEQVGPVQVNDEVEIFGPTLADQTVRGRVVRIHPQGFRKVSSLGVEQQRVLVIIEPDERALQTLRDAGWTLGAEYRMRTRVITDRRENALVIPRAALFRSPEGDWRVFALRNGRAHLHAVEVGVVNPSEAQIRSGLDEGERVILAPQRDLRDGDRVRAR